MSALFSTNSPQFVLGEASGNTKVAISEDMTDMAVERPPQCYFEPGGELLVYSGPGDNTATAYYEGLGQAIWNNSGADKATLLDASGQTIDTYSYSS